MNPQGATALAHRGRCVAQARSHSIYLGPSQGDRKMVGARNSVGRAGRNLRAICDELGAVLERGPRRRPHATRARAFARAEALLLLLLAPSAATGGFQVLGEIAENHLVERFVD